MLHESLMVPAISETNPPWPTGLSTVVSTEGSQLLSCGRGRRRRSRRRGLFRGSRWSGGLLCRSSRSHGILRGLTAKPSAGPTDDRQHDDDSDDADDGVFLIHDYLSLALFAGFWCFGIAQITSRSRGWPEPLSSKLHKCVTRMWQEKAELWKTRRKMVKCMPGVAAIAAGCWMHFSSAAEMKRICRLLVIPAGIEPAFTT